jgi:hypothetical protein
MQRYEAYEVIGGVVCDTATAEFVLRYSNYNVSTLMIPDRIGYREVELYRTPCGHWFVDVRQTGVGRWLQRVGPHAARRLVERHAPECLAEYFGA